MDKNSYIILTGERRYRASKIAEQKLLPCIVHKEKLTESEIKAIQLVENLQRQDLSAIETAKGFKSLTSHGLGQREIARHLGISESTVSKGMKILKTFPVEWVVNIEKQCKQTSIENLYNIAKEKNKNKRMALYSKLMESTEIKVSKEPKVSDKKKPTNIHSKFSEEDMELVWDELKKIIRSKGKTELCKYITPKKIKSILEKTESDF